MFSERVTFVLFVMAAHAATFVYSFFISTAEQFGLLDHYRIGIKHPRPQNSPELLHRLWWKNIKSHLLKMPIMLYLLFPFFKSRGLELDWASWMELTWATVGRDLLISLAINDTGFYWGHRVLHHEALYPRFHKQHHDFKHPVAAAAEWAHAVEDLLCNIMPTIMGPYLLGSHLYVTCLWIFLRLWKALDAHSGYKLPFPLSIWHQWPGALSSELHDFHHEVNMGCFGATTLFWDRVCGTDGAYNEMKKKKEKKKTKKKTN